jgi:hypothetical protein
MNHEIAVLQDKLSTIDKLTNCIQKVTAGQSKEIAYLIHTIIESDGFISSGIARQVQKWQLQANKELFFTA